MEPERASGRGGAIVLLLLIAALAFGARPSPAPGTLLAITHEPFYGWTDAYRMSNGHMAVSVVPAAGGRVLEFSLDGQQALLVNPALQVEVSTNDRTLPYIEMEVLGPLVRLEPGEETSYPETWALAKLSHPIRQRADVPAAVAELRDRGLLP